MLRSEMSVMINRFHLPHKHIRTRNSAAEPGPNPDRADIFRFISCPRFFPGQPL